MHLQNERSQMKGSIFRKIVSLSLNRNSMPDIKYRAYVKHLQIIIEVQRINFDCKTVEWYIVHPDEWDMSEFSFDEIEIIQEQWNQSN